MKIAVVTGSNKGIGKSIVETLYKWLPSDQWKIYLTARNEELGRAVLKELEANDIKVHFHQLNIDVPDSRKELRDHLISQYGGLDILVNNAGIAYKNDSTAPFAEQAEVTCETNFFSTLRMCEEFLSIMKEDGRLVNVSSMVTHMNLPKLSDAQYLAITETIKTIPQLEEWMRDFIKSAKDNTVADKGFPQSAYGMSKLALTKATYILADKYRDDPRHILINSCCPGYVDTDMTSHRGHKTVEQGADTPCYLATLPVGATEPYGKFVSERQVKEFSKTTTVKF